MNKIKITVIIIGILYGKIKSQTAIISDFENFSITNNSYYEDTLSTDFSDGILSFQYDWDTTFSFWSGGFTCSMVQDSITSGYSNLYASKANAGFYGSTKYVVGQQNSRMKFVSAAGPGLINGFYICNSTYAYNSMRDGDFFAKKFGGSSGNDPDWFKLTIKKYVSGNLANDSIEFYLADFRFFNNSQDYIISDWTYVNTQNLGNADSLLFTLSSSDVGTFGMNTPAFFCLDHIEAQPFIGITETNKISDLDFFPNPVSQLAHFKRDHKNLKIDKVEIFNYQGKFINSITRENFINENSIDLTNLERGNYLIKIITDESIFYKKIVKS